MGSAKGEEAIEENVVEDPAGPSTPTIYRFTESFTGVDHLAFPLGQDYWRGGCARAMAELAQSNTADTSWDGMEVNQALKRLVSTMMHSIHGLAQVHEAHTKVQAVAHTAREEHARANMLEENYQKCEAELEAVKRELVEEKASSGRVIDDLKTRIMDAEETNADVIHAKDLAYSQSAALEGKYKDAQLSIGLYLTEYRELIRRECQLRMPEGDFRFISSLNPSAVSKKVKQKFEAKKRDLASTSASGSHPPGQTPQRHPSV